MTIKPKQLAVCVLGMVILSQGAFADDSNDKPGTASPTTSQQSAVPQLSIPPAYPYPPWQRSRPQPPRSYYNNDPWADMRRMQREMRRWQWRMDRDKARMEREMRDRNGHQWDKRSSGIHIQESYSSPKIKIGEDDANFIVTAKIPGADEQSIQVEQRGNRLRIGATRQVEKKETSDGRRMQASFSSKYQRILTLPGSVKENGMKTDYKDEVLTITIPKSD